MGKAQFIKQLEEALSGEVPNAVVYDNIRYYENYISNEIQKGRAESEVMEELGSPRLIARTIIDLYKSQNEDHFQKANQSYQGQEPHFKVFNFNTWFRKIVSWIAIVLFVLFLVWLLTGIASLLMIYAVPILLVIFVFYTIRSLFGRR